MRMMFERVIHFIIVTIMLSKVEFPDYLASMQGE